MLDSKAVVDLIEQQISKNVAEQVAAVMGNGQWLASIEDKITKHIQDRITAKFSNISTVPDLVTTVETSVAKLVEQGKIPGIESYVDTDRLETAIDNSVQTLVETTIDELVIDQAWINKIETIVNNQMSAKLLRKLSDIDINKMLVEEINQGIIRWQDRLLENFKTHGITDSATELQMLVSDQGVTVGKTLSALDLEIERDAKIAGGLTVNNLAVRGVVNVDNNAWDEVIEKTAVSTLEKITTDWKKELVEQVVALSKEQGIEFNDIVINGKPLISGNELNSAITETSIRKVGTLRELTVAGPTSINETFTVGQQRVGINTEHPEMALSVWDEETAIIAGKLLKDNAYIGTARPQALTLGVNRGRHLTIESDGLVVVNQFRIDRWRISHSNAVPGWSGTRGDIVFNIDPRPDQPFGWVCLGSYQWQPLRSA